MSKVTPFLWFNDNAEEAANFYISLFPNSKITSVSRFGDAGPGKPGSVMIISFTLDGREYTALNGGPYYQLNEAFSLYVDCADQAEVDRLWYKLLEGGEESQCGWLKDRFGLSWQIVPSALGRLMGDPDPVKSQRVVQAMLKMVKLDVQGLQDAYDGV